MKKKTLGFLAAVLSMCMLAGCGAKDTGDGTDAATGAGAESTALKDMDCLLNTSMMVLDIEQKMLKKQSEKAKLIVTRDGTVLDRKEYAQFVPKLQK